VSKPSEPSFFKSMETKFKSIVIAHDRTKGEMDECKELVEKAAYPE